MIPNFVFILKQAFDESHILTQQVIWSELTTYSPSLRYLHLAVPMSLGSVNQEKEMLKNFLKHMPQKKLETILHDTKLLRYYNYLISNTV